MKGIVFDIIFSGWSQAFKLHLLVPVHDTYVANLWYFFPCRFGKHYELPLLAQSVIMIGTMMAMMHICVEVNADKGTVVRKLTGN